MSFDAAFCANQESEQIEWTPDYGSQINWWDQKKPFDLCLADIWNDVPAEVNGRRDTQETIEARFSRLADEWSRTTAHISSVNDLINDSSYQKIITMGWAVIPYLLNDLEQNQRFWYPALAAITGLRPFDNRDASNYRRMTDAWIRWGKRKGII